MSTSGVAVLRVWAEDVVKVGSTRTVCIGGRVTIGWGTVDGASEHVHTGGIWRTAWPIHASQPIPSSQRHWWLRSLCRLGSLALDFACDQRHGHRSVSQGRFPAPDDANGVFRSACAPCPCRSTASWFSFPYAVWVVISDIPGTACRPDCCIHLVGSTDIQRRPVGDRHITCARGSTSFPPAVGCVHVLGGCMAPALVATLCDGTCLERVRLRGH